MWPLLRVKTGSSDSVAPFISTALIASSSSRAFHHIRVTASKSWSTSHSSNNLCHPWSHRCGTTLPSPLGAQEVRCLHESGELCHIVILVLAFPSTCVYYNIEWYVLCIADDASQP